MKNTHIYGRQYQVASTWNELTTAQLLRVVHVLFQPATLEYLQSRLIPVLMQLWRRPRLAWQFQRMALLDVGEFIPLTEFLLEPIALTKQLLPHVRRRPWCRRWYGPGDMLAGLTFTEWIDAEAALYVYRKNQADKFLNRLVAILYRPGRLLGASATGDRRQAYHQHEVEQRTLQAEQLPVDTRHAILLYYEGCRRQLIARHPEVFQVAEEAEQPATPKASENPAPAYLRILRELAQGAEKYEVIGQQPIGNIMYELTERIKQAAELEKRLEEIRNK